MRTPVRPDIPRWQRVEQYVLVGLFSLLVVALFVPPLARLIFG